MRNLPLEWQWPSIYPFHLALCGLSTPPPDRPNWSWKRQQGWIVRWQKKHIYFPGQTIGFFIIHIVGLWKSGKDYLKSLIRRILWNRSMMGLGKIYLWALWTCWLDGITEWGQSLNGSFAQRRGPLCSASITQSPFPTCLWAIIKEWK